MKDEQTPEKIAELEAEVEHWKSLVTELKEFDISGRPGNLTAQMKGDMFKMFVMSMGEMLKDYDAENYLTMDCGHPTLGPLTVTIQKKRHLSPCDKLKAAADRWEALRYFIHEKGQTAAHPIISYSDGWKHCAANILERMVELEHPPARPGEEER